MKLDEHKIVLLGYGAQGRAEALNLRKSGVNFSLGLRQGPSQERAIQDGFTVESIPEALKEAHTVIMNLPDHLQSAVYQEFLASRPDPIKRLVFAHGFNTHFGYIPVQPTGPVHILVATKGAAHGLIDYYGTPQALPAILGIRPKNLATDEDLAWTEAYAKAIGANPKALIWSDFRDEAICDLFSEQALLCGGVSSLLRATFETMVSAGYDPQTAYFESLYELKLIVDLIWKYGITGMREKISPTARYGDITRGDRIIGEDVKSKMKTVLQEIEAGEFAREFLREFSEKNFKNLEEKQKNHPLEIIGKKIRNEMNF